MTAPETSAPDRHIPVCYDEHGEPSWHSTTSPPDSSYGVCNMVADRVIPVIFVPGVMGSNLKSKSGKGLSWRLDSDATMLPWATRGAATRKANLTPQAMVVDDGGKISVGSLHDAAHLKMRGWGEVGYTSYGEFLTWLEHNLNDVDNAKAGGRHQLIARNLHAAKGEYALTKDEVALSYRYRFPVWACGYNWLDDNGESSLLLQKRITQAIAYYTKKKLKCEKVIIVTHSMGGLVARHCSEVLGQDARIFGIVHGVMPAIGAAAVYRRAKSGTRSSGGITGALASAVLGRTAAEMTAVFSTAPGPMQLLPTAEYGSGWLRIKVDGQDIQLPKGRDPYSEIYAVRGKWWSLCDDQLMNPLNDAPVRSPGYKSTMGADWNNYVNMIKRKVKPFHESVANKYHVTTYAFYADSKDHLAYGNVTWLGKGGLGDSWLSGGRLSDPLDAKDWDHDQVSNRRTIAAPLRGDGWRKSVVQNYVISDPEEPGDGTVPERSGKAPERQASSILTVSTDHEAAFRECEAGRLFTLRAIVKIAQAVKTTSLAYT
ncbi:MAG: hypothetical protein ABI114_01860 [Rhodanobacter sp.]